MPTNDLTVRPITGRDELDLFCRLPYVLDDELADDLAAGRRRPEWMWVALRGERLLARVAWWGRPADDTPQLLDIVDVEDGATERDDAVDIGVRLLRTAMAATLPEGPRPADGGSVEYSRFVPPHWREAPATRQAVENRMAVLERTGARFFVERLRLEWRPESEALPAPGERLGFRPVHDGEELVALMASALEGTLDAHSVPTWAGCPCTRRPSSTTRTSWRATQVPGTGGASRPDGKRLPARRLPHLRAWDQADVELSRSGTGGCRSPRPDLPPRPTPSPLSGYEGVQPGMSRIPLRSGVATLGA